MFWGLQNCFRQTIIQIKTTVNLPEGKTILNNDQGPEITVNLVYINEAITSYLTVDQIVLSFE